MDSCGSYQGVTLRILPDTTLASWDPHIPFLLLKVPNVEQSGDSMSDTHDIRLSLSSNSLNQT